MVTDPLIASDPANPSNLLLGSYDANCQWLGFHLSADGGSTWTRALCMPWLYSKYFVWVPSYDPAVGYDRNGTAYAAGNYYDNEAQQRGFLAVQKSSDGTHWSKPVIALRRPGQTTPAQTSMAVDISATSPWANSLYVSGVMWSRSGFEVMASHSTDGGTTWTQTSVDPLQIYPEEDDFTRIAVGADGTVYATWQHCRGKKGGGDGGGLCPTVHMMLSKSTDGGNTWSAPVRIATVGMPHYWQLPNTNPGIRASNYPVVALDNSAGPHSGNIYVAMYNWTGSYLKVQVIRSTDGGSTWSQPVPPAPKSDTHDQFFPAISVNKDGLVGVSWLDRRNDPANHNYQAFAAISYDGGKTFGPNWQLTTAFSDPDVNGDYNWMGDYTGNTWVGDKLIAAWNDSSNGVDMQEVVGGVRLK